jgi:hypothetical protein
MTVVMAIQISTSMVEIAAGVGQASAVVAIGTDARRRGVWAWYAVSGVILALTRPFGPFLVILYGLAALLILGRGALDLVRGPGRGRVLGALAVVAASVGAGLVWSLLVMPRAAVSVSETVGNLPESFRRAFSGGTALLGSFGFGGAQPWRSGLATSIYLLLLVAALALGTGRERVVLASAVLVSGAVNLLLDAATQIPYGYRYQPRFGLPFAVFAPVFAGAVVGRHRDRFPAWLRRGRAEVTALLTLSLTIVLVQAYDWWRTAKLLSVGTAGRWIFPGASHAWAPTTGWRLPLALYAAAIAVLGVVSVLNARAVRTPVGAGTIP